MLVFNDSQITNILIIICLFIVDPIFHTLPNFPLWLFAGFGWREIRNTNHYNFVILISVISSKNSDDIKIHSRETFKQTHTQNIMYSVLRHNGMLFPRVTFSTSVMEISHPWINVTSFLFLSFSCTLLSGLYKYGKYVNTRCHRILFDF